MSYLLCVAFLTFILSLIYKPHRTVWLLISGMSFLLWANVHMFDPQGVVLYWHRAIIVTITGGLLIRHGSWLGFYHSIILLVTLVAYAALAYDVAHGMHVLIYNNYEATIYGLVGCQLIAIFPTIRLAYRDHHSDIRAWLVNLQRATRA